MQEVRHEKCGLESAKVWLRGCYACCARARYRPIDFTTAQRRATSACRQDARGHRRVGDDSRDYIRRSKPQGATSRMSLSLTADLVVASTALRRDRRCPAQFGGTCRGPPRFDARVRSTSAALVRRRAVKRGAADHDQGCAAHVSRSTRRKCNQRTPGRILRLREVERGTKCVSDPRVRSQPLVPHRCSEEQLAPTALRQISAHCGSKGDSLVVDGVRRARKFH
jgi:hypothetical protein